MMQARFNTLSALRIGVLATVLLCGGCGQSLVPPLPDIAPFPQKVLSAEESRKAIDDMNAKKEQQVVEAERRIKDGR
jgi:hypothetical protein